MNILKGLILILATSIFLVSCDSGGSSGGGGETQATTTAQESDTQETNTQETEATAQAAEPKAATTVSNSSVIFLSSTSDFSCSSNWSPRDGALGLDAFSGNGTCTAPFPGQTGTYQIVLNAQIERDGQPSYLISIDGADVNGGRYPLSDPRGCGCSYEDCPDKNYDINAGTHTISNGSTIGFYGTEDFPCGGDHGAYAKWHGITFTRIN